MQVFLRIISLTPKVFFSCISWHNVVDFIVVLLAFAATIAASLIIENIPEEDKEVRKIEISSHLKYTLFEQIWLSFFYKI